LKVVHHEGGTQKRPNGRALSSQYYYWNCRNRLVFAAKHLSFRQALRWMRGTPTESWHIYLRGGRRQILHSPKGLAATLRGSLTGLLVAGTILLRRRSVTRYPFPVS
jgi:hypothetical protein